MSRFMKLIAAACLPFFVATTAFGANMPFPQVKDYGLKPSEGNWVDHRDAIIKYYEQYKSRYKKEYEGMTYYESKATDGSNWTITVSEQHGYAMIITAMMAGHDSNAQTIFNSLVDFYDAYKQDNNLMHWRVWSGGSAAEGSATDGDLDIAYALLLADKQWGSDGAHDYLSKALAIMDGIWAHEINTSTNLTLLGDSWYNDRLTRPSDWMANHFRVFDRYDDGSDWGSIVTGVYNKYNSVANSSTGLVADFYEGNTPGGGGETAHDDDYYTNACRVPMRFAMDYATSGSNDAASALQSMVSWIGGKTGNDAANIVNGYELDGTEIGEDQSLIYMAPLGAACVATDNQELLNSVWNYINTDYLYDAEFSDAYNEAVALLSMMVMTGNWWEPGDKNTHKTDGVDTSGVIFDHFGNEYGDDNSQTHLGAMNGAYWGDAEYGAGGGDTTYYHGGGYYYVFDDSEDGGTSVIKGADGTVLDSETMDNMVTDNTLDVTFVLGKEDDMSYGYVGFGAEIMSDIAKDGDSVITTGRWADLSQMTGVTVRYKSDGDVTLALESQDIFDKIGYGGYEFTLSATGDELKKQTITMDRFSKPDVWIGDEKSDTLKDLSWEETGKTGVKSLTFQVAEDMDKGGETNFMVEEIYLNGITHSDLGIDYRPAPVIETLSGTERMGFRTVDRANSLSVLFDADQAGTATATFYNAAGKKVMEEAVSARAGANEITFSKAGISSGVYFMTIKTGSRAASARINIMK
ncbi:MAG: glycosyl hydrolase family 8 [Fibrobacterota bacterium]